jgi:DnaJ-class molecular chaperone
MTRKSRVVASSNAQKPLTVKVPAGIKTDSKIRYAGKGNAWTTGMTSVRFVYQDFGETIRETKKRW